MVGFTRVNASLSAMVAACILAASWTNADTEDIEDLDEHQTGAGYAHLISFEAEPEIAAANYTVDAEDSSVGDADINSFKLPLYREFSNEDHDWRWYAQGSLSYLTLDQTFRFNLAPDQKESMDMEWTAYGGLVEAGFIFPLSGGFSLVSGMGLGVSHLENDADFSSPLLEQVLPPEFDGRLYDWDTNAALVRGNLGLRYDQLHGEFRIKGSANLSYSYIDSFDESSNFSGFDDHASTFTFKLDARYPLDRQIREHPLYIIGHIGNTTFVGSNRNSLGFKYFNELGVSLGVEKITLGALVLLGSDVDGWTIVLNYDY